MIIKVCIGSACHLKGSYEVIQRLKCLIEENDMTNKIELKSSFCLGECANGVSVQIDSQPIKSVSPDTIDNFFEAEILKGLKI